MDTSELKRRAGIIEGDIRLSGADPAFIATNFINGNQSDAFNAMGTSLALFAEVALHMGESYGQEAMMNFIQFAARRGQ